MVSLGPGAWWLGCYTIDVLREHGNRCGIIGQHTEYFGHVDSQFAGTEYLLQTSREP